MADDTDALSDESPVTEPVIPAEPPYQAFTPPPGVPPLVPDTPEIRKLLGGPPLPMHIGRVSPAAKTSKAAPASALPLAANLSSTFSGAPAGDPAIKAAIEKTRATLGAIILGISEAEKTIPDLLAAIEPEAGAALLGENFDLAEARAFFDSLVTALTSIRLS